MSETKTNYRIQTKINRPVAEVFSAVVDDQQLCKYFTGESSGPLEEGKRIIWHWDGYSEEGPVIVKRVRQNEEILLEIESREWMKTQDEHYSVLVRFNFEALEDGNTLLSISESGWKVDAPGLKASHENCGGWQHMALCLKMYLEHGIDARL